MYRLYQGDSKTEMQKLESQTVQTCITSPPYYGLRDYGVDGQIGLEPTPEASPDLIEPCVLAGSKEGDTVLDPFNGSGTTGYVSVKHRRDYIGVELNPDYIELSKKRLAEIQTDLL
jgi:DNA modification methylase